MIMNFKEGPKIMYDKHKAEFMKELVMMAELFGKDLTESLMELYWRALSDMSLDNYKKAISSITQTATFFPKPVDFRDAIAGDIDTKAIIAWEKVMKAKSSVGSYGSVKFDDPIIHSVISMMGGWVGLCRGEGYDSEKWQRMEFEKSYKALSKTNMQHPEHLLGASDIDNKAKGYADRIKQPMLIESPTGKQKVIEG